MRAAVGLVVAAALLCGSYGLLGQLCVRRAADIELVFHGDAVAAPRDSTTQGAGEVRVIEDHVEKARATPENLVILALLCAIAARAATRRTRIRHPRHPLSLPWLALSIPILLSGACAIYSVARGYDALWYHLPLAAAFMRAHHLEPPGRDLVFYFPANVELLARSLGDVFGARGLPLVQLPFALALGPLTAGLARRIGAGRAAPFAGAIALGCPMVIFQAGLGYADLVATAALVAAALFAVEAAIADQARALALAAAAGLCLGLGLGSKYAALPLVGSGLPVIFACAMRAPHASRIRIAHLARALAICAVLVAAMAIPAWFWYARNTRLTGNPLFPIAVPRLGLRGLFVSSAFNREKELELVGSHAQWLAYPWIEALSHESGFGAAFAALVPVSLAPLLWRFATELRRGRLPRFALPLMWALAYLATWWFGTPHEVRHLLPLVPLLGAPAVLLLRGAGATAVGLRQVGVCALALGSVVVLRLQLFSAIPEISLQRTSFSSLYAFPPEPLSALPAGSRIANLASRPYNFALLGPRLDLSLIDFSPGLPDAAALADRGARFVFARGPDVELVRKTGEIPGHPWQVRYQARVVPDPDWSFWGTTGTTGTTANDTIVLWEIP